MQNDIFEKLNADSYVFSAYKKKGYTTPNALKRAQNHKKAWENWRALSPKERKNATTPNYPRFTYFNSSNKEGVRWVENTSESLRIVEKDSEGWYIDSMQSDVIHACVIALPHGNFYPAYSDAFNEDCHLVNFADCYDNKEDAFYQAKRFVERESEKMREYDSAWQAGNRYSQTKEEIKTTKQEAIKLLKARRKAKAIECEEKETLCNAIESQARNMIHRLSKMKKQCETLLNGDCVDCYFFPRDKTMQEAFNDGASEQVFI